MPEHLLIVPPSDGGAALAGTLQDLIGASTEIALAVRHVRLSALERVVPLLPMLRRCRLILGHFSAAGNPVSATINDNRHDRLCQLLEHARSARFEVRSAGAGRWEPDFSLFHLAGHADFSACMFGAHYLLPLDEIEWPLTCVFTRAGAVKQAHRHFEHLWAAAHDVRPALISTLEQELCS